jgi:RNA polymerase sigma-70 factor (ECF subfamily)
MRAPHLRSRTTAARDSEEAVASSSVSLLFRAQQGDDSAREELCARYLPRLRRWAHGRLPASARQHLDTEDLVQDTLLQTVRHLDGFTPHHERAFCAYVCQALGNRVKDAVRAANRRPSAEPLGDDHTASSASPLDEAVKQQTLDRYNAALDRLSQVERHLVLARVELGLPYAHVAELLERPSAAAARMATSRALVRLAREMSRDAGR